MRVAAARSVLVSRVTVSRARQICQALHQGAPAMPQPSVRRRRGVAARSVLSARVFVFVRTSGYTPCRTYFDLLDAPPAACKMQCTSRGGPRLRLSSLGRLTVRFRLAPWARVF